jgi:hypothetical protein
MKTLTGKIALHRMKLPFLILALAVTSFGRALGCSCDAWPPMDVEFARSDSVFVGRVVQMTVETRTEGSYRHEVKVCRFQVIEAFKGVEAQKKEFTIVTRMSGTACGFPFELGERYLVYASLFHGEMETGICQRTQALVQPKQDAVIVTSANPFEKGEMDESGRVEAEQLRAFLKKK